MKNKAIYGREGENGKLYLYLHDTLFATAEYFTALIEEVQGSGVVYGHRIQLILNGLTILDEVGAKEMLYDMQIKDGGIAFDFEGLMKRRDGHKERVIFRRCIPIGAIDIPGLASGFMESLALTVNSIPDKTQKSLGMI